MRCLVLVLEAERDEIRLLHFLQAWIFRDSVFFLLAKRFLNFYEVIF